MKIIKPVIAVLCLLCTTHSWASIADLQPVKRIALITGSNDGGAYRVALKYAESDAIISGQGV